MIDVLENAVKELRERVVDRIISNGREYGFCDTRSTKEIDGNFVKQESPLEFGVMCTPGIVISWDNSNLIFDGISKEDRKDSEKLHRHILSLLKDKSNPIYLTITVEDEVSFHTRNSFVIFLLSCYLVGIDWKKEKTYVPFETSKMTEMGVLRNFLEKGRRA